MAEINSGRGYPLIKHSKKEMASMNVASIAIELIQGVLSILIFFFYEAELGLNSLLAGLGIAIYAVYDAFNDPLVGYLTDRPFKWTKKWGRRFPFIIIFFIPMLLFFVLIFSPPVFLQDSQFGLFGWLVFTTCIFDTVESFFTINFWALGPDKFRNQKERRGIATFEVYLGFIGVILSFVVPPLIIGYGNISSYALMAWVCVGISVVCWFLMIPGVRDDKPMVEYYLKTYETEEKEPFFKSLKGVLTQKNYMAFLLLYILYQAMIQIMQASVFYHTRFILNVEADVVTVIILMLFVGGLISLPFWIWYTNKSGNNRLTWIICACFMAIFAFPLTFVTTLAGVMIVIFLYGLAFGGFWVMITPIYSDVIDESVVISGRRKEATYGGIRQFFLNLARVIQALTLAFVHEITGFVEGGSTQSASAIFGIQLHFGVIPAIFIGIGVLIFWKFYDITPEKSKQLKEQLREAE
ncbi:MAG: MFS transporter [Candidatus Lokiarchaeota archaeon]|nr:MFS transporter [Candidatus Lokiarchaeota archaeon]MBD3342285.1 MFS transporter [Candidatus Lokiarchaeota archaeon]